MTVSDTRTAPGPGSPPRTLARWGGGLERVTVALLLGFVASLQVSIALAQILLALTLVCWVALRIRDRAWPSAPSFFLPLTVYAALTLLVSFFSIDPMGSIIDSKQLLLFLLVPAVYDIARGHRLEAYSALMSRAKDAESATQRSSGIPHSRGNGTASCTARAAARPELECLAGILSRRDERRRGAVAARAAQGIGHSSLPRSAAREP